MEEKEKEALTELAKLCEKYNFEIQSIENKVCFVFVRRDRPCFCYYSHGFDKYTKTVRVWDTVAISEDTK